MAHYSMLPFRYMRSCDPKVTGRDPDVMVSGEALVATPSCKNTRAT